MMSTNRIVLEDHQWLVLYTYPNREKAAAREANKLNIETFLPMHTEYRQWHDRVKKVQVPLFRNYVFVRPDAQQKHLIYNINHVSHFVCSEGRPSVVHDKEIELVKALLVGNYQFETNINLRRGVPILIVNGPFAGWNGTFAEEKGKGEVLVQLPTIGHEISIQLPKHCLQVLSDS